MGRAASDSPACRIAAPCWRCPSGDPRLVRDAAEGRSRRSRWRLSSRFRQGSVELLLVGTGVDLVPVPDALRRSLKAAGIVAEPMATGAAARTYNILLGENRRVGAALLAVS